MRSRPLIVALAILAVLAFATIVVASSMSGDAGGAHTMQDGSTMPDDQMTP